MSGWDWYLLVFSVLFALGPLCLRPLLIWRATGRNPVHLESPDTPMGCVQVWLGIALLGYGLMIGLRLFWPGAWAGVPRLAWLDSDPVRLAGVGLTLGGLLCAWAAQAQMGKSWRFGLDAGHAPPLVTTGVFAIIRNPIYLSILLAAAGVLLLQGDAVTLALLAIAGPMLTVLVRLEEAFLRQVHGAAYAAYVDRVGRFWPRWPRNR